MFHATSLMECTKHLATRHCSVVSSEKDLVGYTQELGERTAREISMKADLYKLVR